jgi:hypothetical protein
VKIIIESTDREQATTRSEESMQASQVEVSSMPGRSGFGAVSIMGMAAPSTADPGAEGFGLVSFNGDAQASEAAPNRDGIGGASFGGSSRAAESRGSEGFGEVRFS